jgi:hypothetical protein
LAKYFSPFKRLVPLLLPSALLIGCATRSVTVHGRFEAPHEVTDIPAGSTFAIYMATSPSTAENNVRIRQLAGHLLRERGYDIRSEDAAFGLVINYDVQTQATPERAWMPW